MHAALVKTVVTLILLTGWSARAQVTPSHPVTWDANPVYKPLDPVRDTTSAVVLLDERRMEIQPLGTGYQMYRTVHRTVQIADEKGIAVFNVIALPIAKGHELVELKARTISPSGKETIATRKQFEKTASEEGVPEYRHAFEGITKGSVVEFIFCVRRPLIPYGYEQFGVSLPVREGRFMLVAPPQLVFETKGYNGITTTETTDLPDSMRAYKASFSGSPARQDEVAANDAAAARRLAYRLSYVAGERRGVRLLTWNDLAKDLYESYIDVSEKDIKSAGKYLRQASVPESGSVEDRILAIENQLKHEMSLSDQLGGTGEEPVADILQKKKTNERGLMRCYAACFQSVGIPYEVAATSNRFEDVVDDQFEVYSSLSDLLFYFPQQQHYLAPAAMAYRYPWTPYQYNTNKVILTKTTTLGTARSARSAVKTMESMPYTASGHHTEAVIRWPDGISSAPVAEVTSRMEGYNSIDIRRTLNWGDEEDKKELVNRISGVSETPEALLNYTIEHPEFEALYRNAPVVLKARIKGDALMEKAGPRYLLQLGKVIGQQSQMYEAEARTLPLDIGYAHTLKRQLQVEVPDGYRIVNPEATKFQVTIPGSAGGRQMGFTSDYHMNGTTLVVDILEDYQLSQMPSTEYDAYRKVVNAAADFNKVALVLEKK
jgi:hypothetical protein